VVAQLTPTHAIRLIDAFNRGFPTLHKVMGKDCVRAVMWNKASKKSLASIMRSRSDILQGIARSSKEPQTSARVEMDNVDLRNPLSITLIPGVQDRTITISGGEIQKVQRVTITIDSRTRPSREALSDVIAELPLIQGEKGYVPIILWEKEPVELQDTRTLEELVADWEKFLFS